MRRGELEKGNIRQPFERQLVHGYQQRTSNTEITDVKVSKETRIPYNMFALGQHIVRSNNIDPWPLHLCVNGKREHCWFSQSPVHLDSFLQHVSFYNSMLRKLSYSSTERRKTQHGLLFSLLLK